ncbi:MAG: (d)CMP kinase [Pseudomonadota bacterium]
MTNSISNIPVITIDGPSGVGKGTLSALLAKHHGWNYLDSGALYRITAYAALINHIPLTDAKEKETEIAKLALSLNIQFKNNGEICLDNNNIYQSIRTQECGNNASIIAALPKVREALLQKQKNFLTAPGLVADGRDMGTVVFPQALYKIFLTASAEERGKRRYKQLQNNEDNAIVSGSPECLVSIEKITDEIKQRDERDMNRSISPLIPAKDAFVIDTSNMSVDEVFNKILSLCQPV